jgi:uncharacterized protein (DUF2141 family)
MVTLKKRFYLSALAPVLASVAVFTLTMPGFSAAAELTITVNDLSSTLGDVHIALYDDAQRFPNSEGIVDEIKLPITASKIIAIFTDLAPGRYAIAAYHDENSNHEFDQGLFGIPMEDYAFSNNTRNFLTPPSFDESAFTVPIEGSHQKISFGN